MTKYMMSEQVLFRIAAGWPDVSESVQLVDIMAAIPQVANSFLKAQQFSVNLPAGETMPENLMLGIYENIAVESINYSTNQVSKSKATLPIQPIALPKNMGIYQIYAQDYPDSPFIPIQAGQGALLKTDALLSDILGQISYEPKGKTIFFSKDLPQYEINEVTMELVVMDISQYGDTDSLPIPSDMEAAIIEQLVNMFSRVGNETGIVNPFTNIKNQPQKLVKQTT